jgi:8-hydroxy-5-deazaflavin:NADPH oxidoreductase
MQIGILGTGIVGQTLAAGLAAKGHAVMIGTRDPAETLARTTGGPMTKSSFKEWQATNPSVKLGTFAEAARSGEALINATSGSGAMPALQGAGADALGEKVLLDASNPLDFSKGFPPTLSVCNTDSLGEQIQRAFPGVRVVKSLNTITAALMVDPGQVAGGDHHVFVSGDDPDAKAQVMRLLTDGFGWRQVIDLGDITSARAAEMYVASGSACSAPSAPHGQPQGGHLRVRGAGAARPG